MILSVPLSCLTDRCQFEGLGFPFRAGAYTWMNVRACPHRRFHYQNRKPGETLTDITNGKGKYYLCLCGSVMFVWQCVFVSAEQLAAE